MKGLVFFFLAPLLFISFTSLCTGKVKKVGYLSHTIRNSCEKISRECPVTMSCCMHNHTCWHGNFMCKDCVKTAYSTSFTWFVKKDWKVLLAALNNAIRISLSSRDGQSADIFVPTSLAVLKNFMYKRHNGLRWSYAKRHKVFILFLKLIHRFTDMMIYIYFEYNKYSLAIQQTNSQKQD